MIQQKSALKSPILKQIVGIVILAIAYYATAEISRHVASTPQDVTPVWPPDGIGTGAVLLFGNWLGYGVLLGSFLANFWAFRDTTTVLSLILSTLPVLGIAIGTTLGTLFGASLLRKLTKGHYPLTRVTSVFQFLILTGMVGPTINATIGVACLVLSGAVPLVAYGAVWLTWWISNVSGIFIVTPVLLSWGQLLRKNQPPIWHWQSPNAIPPNSMPRDAQKFLWRPKTSLSSKLWFIAELGILVSLVCLISIVAFGEGHHLEYMLIPVLLWSAFRLQQQVTTLLTFAVAAIAIISTVNGQGSFVVDDLNQSLIQLQSFIGVITLTILLLTAAIVERTQSEDKLRLAFAELAKSNENLEQRVQQRTQELNEKNKILNQTLGTLKRTQSQMVQNEKMSALGQMVAGISHEINNPINFIHGNIKYIHYYLKDLLDVLQSYQEHYPQPPEKLQNILDEAELDFLQEDLAKLLKSVESGSERIRQIVLSLRNFSRLDESAFKSIDIHEGIDNTLLIVKHRLTENRKFPAIKIAKNYGQLPFIECYAAQLNQVFLNLLTNAIDAIQEIYQEQCKRDHQIHAGEICIATQMIDGDLVQITISDNGSGIPDTVLPRIFDPFLTTKAVGQGTGLGLSISYQIITEKHHGKLWCDSTPGKGSIFFVAIPICQAKSGARPHYSSL